MSIFADLKKKGDKRFVNPRSLAEAIVEAIPRKEELFAKTSVAGPGFINVTLSPVVLSERVQYAAQNSAGEPLPLELVFFTSGVQSCARNPILQQPWKQIGSC
mmetsp:Transcript_6687/g.17122  ORF Transcript_6687/g.17122 Transcript_6687/m.17122 type:complete len:103 (-) Transcript_6687:1858-2166(-)